MKSDSPTMSTDNTQHAPTPWTFDEVQTSCGRAFRIGSRECIDGHEASKGSGSRALPAYACIYDDWGRGETVNKANAAFIVKAVNSYDADKAAIRKLREAIAGLMQGSKFCSYDDDPPMWQRIAMPSEEALNAARAALETTKEAES